MLNTLATHPEHQGKGAGSMLVSWGVNLAHELGLEMYLDTPELGDHCMRNGASSWFGMWSLIVCQGLARGLIGMG